ncbi:MAG: hypothetical protein IPK60_22430 [Sandaracinaceae bacterium]|nr:hypothetical protein [Sandaracinaceae bacterium]
MTPALRLMVLIAAILAACTSEAPPVGTDAGNDSGPEADAHFDASDVADASQDMGTSLDLGEPIDMSVGDAGADAGVDAGNACDFADALDDSCSEDADCEYFVHQTDCCGNTFAYGINVSDIDQALAQEPLCRDFYPACGCPAMQTNTDSDERAGPDATIHVGCIQLAAQRVCQTYVAMRPVDAF